MKMAEKLAAADQLLYISGQYNEVRTGRSAPHPGAEEHHEEKITADTLIDFFDYSSVECGFHEN